MEAQINVALGLPMFPHVSVFGIVPVPLLLLFFILLVLVFVLRGSCDRQVCVSCKITKVLVEGRL